MSVVRGRALALVAGVGILCLMSAPRWMAAEQTVAAQSGAPAPIEQPPATDTPEWMRALAVRPGSSLPEETPLRQQVITFFSVSEQRAEGGQYFVAGKGYAEINGGGTYFSGMNRSQDPFLELTILPSGSPALEDCQHLLASTPFEKNAVAISGVGYFASMSGVQGRQLGIFHLDTLAGCKLVQRY